MDLQVRLSSRAIHWLYAIVVAADLLCIALTAMSDLGWSFIPAALVTQGDLKEEGVLAVWYSSALLLLNGLACLCVAFRGPARRWRLLWLVVASGFLAVSADETAQIHERVGKRIGRAGLSAAYVPANEPVYNWLMPAIPLAALFTGTLLGASRSWKRDASRSRSLALGGMACWVGVLAAELAESQMVRVGMARGLQGAAEEGLELAGSTLFLMAFLESLRTPHTADARGADEGT